MDAREAEKAWRNEALEMIREYREARDMGLEERVESALLRIVDRSTDLWVLAEILNFSIIGVNADSANSR